MSGYVFAVMTRDPLTGKPASIHAEIDWNLGTAAVVADNIGGTVVCAVRGPWMVVPEEAVEEALAESLDAVADDDLRRMLDGAPQDTTNEEVT